MKILGKKQTRKYVLPDPREPNGEVKEAEHHVSVAMDSIGLCIRRTQNARRATQRVAHLAKK
jgi:hypothetical protein